MRKDIDDLKPLVKQVGDLTDRCEGMEKRITMLETSKNEVMKEFKML